MAKTTSLAPELSKEEKKYRRVVRKRVVIEEECTDAPDPQQYEPVSFIFWNEEQRGVPIPYEWVDKWTPIGKCKGMMYDGQKYTLPRIVFEYLRDKCGYPEYSQVQQELVPGQMHSVSKAIGFKKRFRMEEIKV
jgi:hypothetical protein